MELDQYFTPYWLAEALVERHFSRLGASDVAVEPCCGEGAFLAAIPRTVPAYGVEIDVEVAARARALTGRQVIEGDFRTVELEARPTAIIGNPPFNVRFIKAMLQRCWLLLPEEGRAGLILPSYFFQTAHSVVDLNEHWSIAQEMIPRNAFSARMATELVFALFTKDRRRELVGFALYREAADVQEMHPAYRAALATTHGSAWRAVCRLALTHLGGRGTLQQIYAQLERNRPTRTKFWREKIRQTLRAYSESFRALDTGLYEVI